MLSFHRTLSALLVLVSLLTFSALHEAREAQAEAEEKQYFLEQELVRITRKTASDALDRHAALIIESCVNAGRRDCTIMIGEFK